MRSLRTCVERSSHAVSSFMDVKPRHVSHAAHTHLDLPIDSAECWTQPVDWSKLKIKQQRGPTRFRHREAARLNTKRTRTIQVPRSFPLVRCSWTLNRWQAVHIEPSGSSWEMTSHGACLIQWTPSGRWLYAFLWTRLMKNTTSLI